MQLNQILKELQRRHVVKAGIAYLVVSWLIIQVLSILFPAFEASSSAMKTTITILGVGFPVWLVIAWVYDFSAEGVVKTNEITHDPAKHRKKNNGLNRFIIGGLSIAVILLVFNTFRVTSKMNRIDSIYQKALMTNFTSSIAVLAFENLSPEKDQDYFAKGLSEQIQRRLTKQKDLLVKNTNSSFIYKDQDVSIEVIGKELEVSFVLKGSVIKSGDTFRVDVDLINTLNGTTIWSKQFDQKVEDILYTYDEIAQAVVTYLKLTFDYEDVRLRKVDPEAYDLHLRSWDVLSYFQDSTSVLADSLIRKSIDIDPTYGPSWATLSMTTLHKGLYWEHYSVEESIKIGSESANKSIELDPEFALGWVWVSNWQWHAREAKNSEMNLVKALELAPNDSEVLNYAQHQSIRTNKIEQAVNFGKKSVLIDPKNYDTYGWKAAAEEMAGLYEEAEKSAKMNIKLSKDKEGLHGWLAEIYGYQGKVDKALKELDNESNLYAQLLYKCIVYYANDLLDEGEQSYNLLKKFPKEGIPEWGDKNFDLAIVYAARNDKDKAFYHLNKSHDYINVYLENLFVIPEFKNLYDDPRWDELLEKIGEEFNYDFKNKT